jgi:integrase
MSMPPVCQTLHAFPYRDGGRGGSQLLAPSGHRGKRQCRRQKGYIAALKFLYREIVKRPEVVESLPSPKLPKRLPLVLSREEVMAIFEATEFIKHKAIVATGYGAGLRIAEVAGLRTTDIDSKRMRIRVQGKGQKERHSILSPLLLELLRDYYRQMPPKGDWLFPGQRAGTHVCTATIHVAFKRA